VRYETSYEFDGMGRMTRERIMQWDNTNKKMLVMQDKRTTCDPGNRPHASKTRMWTPPAGEILRRRDSAVEAKKEARGALLLFGFQQLSVENHATRRLHYLRLFSFGKSSASREIFRAFSQIFRNASHIPVY